MNIAVADYMPTVSVKSEMVGNPSLTVYHAVLLNKHTRLSFSFGSEVGRQQFQNGLSAGLGMLGLHLSTATEYIQQLALQHYRRQDLQVSCEKLRAAIPEVRSSKLHVSDDLHVWQVELANESGSWNETIGTDYELDCFKQGVHAGLKMLNLV